MNVMGVEGAVTFETASDGGRSNPTAPNGPGNGNVVLGLLSFHGNGAWCAITVFDQSPQFRQQQWQEWRSVVHDDRQKRLGSKLVGGVDHCSSASSLLGVYY